MNCGLAKHRPSRTPSLFLGLEWWGDRSFFGERWGDRARIVKILQENPITMQTQNIKTIARQLIEQLPETCTWDDLMEQIYIQQTIAAGLADSAAGRLKPVEDVRKMFGLNP
jgi:predicted transcriptional regulator